MEAPVSREEHEVVSAVARLLARYEAGGEPAAEAATGRDFAGALLLTVRPANPAAAPVDVRVVPDGRIEVKVAHNRFDIVTDHSGPTPVELMTGILEAVFGGRAEEAPGRKGGTLRLELYDGRKVKVGEAIGPDLGGRSWTRLAAYGDAPRPAPPPPPPSRLARLQDRIVSLFGR